MGCANVAGLLLARMATRRNEVGCVALGASRGRVMRQPQGESAAGHRWRRAGVFVARADCCFKVVPRFHARSRHARRRVLGFTVLVVLAASVLFALCRASGAAKEVIIDP